MTLLAITALSACAHVAPLAASEVRPVMVADAPSVAVTPSVAHVAPLTSVGTFTNGATMDASTTAALVDNGSTARIAEVAHEVNRAYCATIGDNSQPKWSDAPAWQRDSACAGVFAIRSGKITTPEQSHESWSAHKIADGWQYGAVKDPDNKLHPCLVAYPELPPEQQIKDALFFAVVQTMSAQLG